MTTQAAPTRRFGATVRSDRWWLAPLATGAGLTAFGIYSIVVAAMGTDYLYTGGGARYLSPFYSPDLRSWGLHLSFTYAFFVVWVPLGFRLTCYYYRKAYYRSFFLSPPACAVPGPSGRRYRGETKLPYILLNAHRFFLYLATIVLGFLWYDAVRAFLFRGSSGSLEFGVGLGSLVMLANVILLSLFTFGCNSARHLVGGRLNCFTCSAAAHTRHRLWRGVTVLNRWHMQWAWISLCAVAITDLYIRLAAAGVFHDPRII
jgi:UDP-N-acetylmuramyl pentapeptide phosphotransferase/UDP-N-acetylglucosamine-1-phosphate transferase